MMYKFAVLLAAMSAVSAAPIKFTREVPQEHSHEKFLTSVRKSLQKNNPDQIADPVFGLLGNAAASQGQGKITDTDCLHQATADQAFTNAKAAKDVQGMVDALVYRALERNTGKVGLPSVLCTAIKAKNPEIAALQQHQDPASAGAKDLNKKIALELAKQIASVGGDPLIALQSGTFAPGNLNDNTGKGNTCDDPNDPVGCIFTQKLLVEDATADEILAAVGKGGAGGNNAGDKNANGNGGGNNNNNGNGGVDNAATCGPPEIVTVTVIASATAPAVPPKATSTSAAQPTETVASNPPSSADGNQSDNKGDNTSAPASSSQAAPSNTQVSPPPAASTTAPAPTAPAPTATAAPTAAPAPAVENFQPFTAGLGGILPPAITKGGKGFIVDGDEFINLSAAQGRSCDKQHNACANAANASRTAGFTVGDCDKQNDQCKAATA